MGQKKHHYHFHLQKPEDIYNLAMMAASSFSEPEEVFTGIYELLINAVEHGNLGIGSEKKGQLLREGSWQDEMHRRLSAPDNANKMVNIEVVEEQNHCKITITDQGSGFNWKASIDYDINHNRPHGRGLWIVLNSGFDSVTFNEDGNSVTCELKSGRKKRAKP
jgi:two-component system cell cycle response regulator